MPVPSRNILLVEDNPDDEALTLRALSRNNVNARVIVVHDGQEALEWLAAADEPPALILLDLQLPKIDGLEVLRRLRANPRTALVPVVILTSSKEDRDRAGGYRGGANSYVQKPVDFAEFVDAVRQLGVYWLVLNQPPPGDATSSLS
jgi:two-component system response regulator